MKNISKLTSLKNFLSGGLVCTGLRAIWESFATPERIPQGIYWIIMIAFAILTIVFFFIDRYKRNIEKAKSPDSDGGEEVTAKERAEALKDATLSVIPLVDELRDLIKERKQLLDKREDDECKLLDTGKKTYFKDIKKTDKRLVEVNARIDKLNELKANAMVGIDIPPKPIKFQEDNIDGEE